MCVCGQRAGADPPTPHPPSQSPKSPGLRPLTERDVPSACALLNRHLSKFVLHPHFTEAEFAHWLIPRPGVVSSFVISGGDNGAVTDLLSYYHLPSSVIGHREHTDLFAVYSYYNVPGTVSLEGLLEDALILARREGVDVFNALDVLANGAVLPKLKFGPGDGTLHYYVYNYATKPMAAGECGLVLL